MRNSKMNRYNTIISEAKNSKAGRAHGIAVLLAALLLMISATAGVFAGGVTFEGQSEGFFFSPGGKDAPTNVFEGTDALMPGDSISENIGVRNSSPDEVKLYMRALGATDEDKDFLSQLSLSVDSESGEVFNSPASEKAGLTEWTLLGTLAPGGSTTLAMTLSAPIEMGNEYQNASGEVNWQFMAEVPVEEDPDDPDEPGEPAEPGNPDGGSGGRTGDSTNLILPIALLLGAGGGIVLIRRRRKA